MSSVSHSGKRVFVSYCHRDKKHLERLHVHLIQYEQAGVMEVWSDKRLVVGSDWREEIKRAIAEAKVAILLVSADFLASKFITENELPPLLDAAKAGGTVIIPVIVGASAFSASVLAHFHTANNPAKPLNGLDPHQRDVIWVDVAMRVKSALESERHESTVVRSALPKQAIESSPAKTAPTSADVVTVHDVIDSLIGKGWQVDLMSIQHMYWKLDHPGKSMPIVITGHLDHVISRRAWQRVMQMA